VNVGLNTGTASIQMLERAVVDFANEVLCVKKLGGWRERKGERVCVRQKRATGADETTTYGTHALRPAGGGAAVERN